MGEGADPAAQSGQVGQAEFKVRMQADLADWLSGYAERAGEHNSRGEPNRNWAIVDAATRLREIEATGGQASRELGEIAANVKALRVIAETELRVVTQTMALAMVLPGPGQGEGQDGANGVALWDQRDREKARAAVNGYLRGVGERLGVSVEEV